MAFVLESLLNIFIFLSKNDQEQQMINNVRYSESKRANKNPDIFYQIFYVPLFLFQARIFRSSFLRVWLSALCPGHAPLADTPFCLGGSISISVKGEAVAGSMAVGGAPRTGGCTPTSPPSPTLDGSWTSGPRTSGSTAGSTGAPWVAPAPPYGRNHAFSSMRSRLESTPPPAPTTDPGAPGLLARLLHSPL